MAWTYSDYDTYAYGSATYIERARLFRQEIRNRIDSTVTSDGQSEDTTPLLELLASVNEDLRPLERGSARSQKVMMGNTRGR